MKLRVIHEFGQEALASAQGGPGFNVAKFLNFFLLITFAYCFVRFYDVDSWDRLFAERLYQWWNESHISKCCQAFPPAT